MQRRNLIDSLASRLDDLTLPHTVRVAIDGVDAAGKTMLADELAAALQARGRPTIRASIDGFHNPARMRVDYYRDSFNESALIGALLEPLGAGGSGWYCERVFDFRVDSAVEAPAKRAPSGAILLFDGVFLLRPALIDYWDFSIFLRVDLEETLRRAVVRDAAMFGGATEVRARYLARYIPGQKLYLQEVQPEQLASTVIDNNDPREPAVIR